MPEIRQKVKEDGHLPSRILPIGAHADLAATWFVTSPDNERDQAEARQAEARGLASDDQKTIEGLGQEAVQLRNQTCPPPAAQAGTTRDSCPGRSKSRIHLLSTLDRVHHSIQGGVTRDCLWAEEELDLGISCEEWADYFGT